MFQSIETTGKVKSYTVTDKGIKVTFKDAFFNGEDRESLDEWINDEECQVKVTIETFNPELPMRRGSDD